MRISYPDEDILLMDDDVKSAFRYYKYHPDVAGVFVFIVIHIAVSVVDVVYVSSSLIPVVRVNASSSILGMKESIHGPKESVHCNSSLVCTALDLYDTTPLACVWTLGTSCGNYTSSTSPTWTCNGRWLLGGALRVAVSP